MPFRFIAVNSSDHTLTPNAHAHSMPFFSAILLGLLLARLKLDSLEFVEAPPLEHPVALATVQRSVFPPLGRPL